MDVLADRKTAGRMTGDVRVNGFEKDAASFARVMGARLLVILLIVFVFLLSSCFSCLFGASIAHEVCHDIVKMNALQLHVVRQPACTALCQ